MTLEKLPHTNQFRTTAQRGWERYFDNVLSWIEKMYYDIVQRLNASIAISETIIENGAGGMLAKITANGGYGDPRYTVTEQQVNNSSGDATAVLSFADKSGGYVGCATNLDELIADSQDLPVDGTVYVLVFSSEDQQSPAVRHYFFSGPAIVVD